MKIKNKKTKSLFIPRLITFIVIIILVIFTPSTCYDCNETLKEDILPLYVCGLIIKKYYDKNHNYERLFYTENNKEIYFHIRISYAQHLWDAVQIGDSIFKEAGSDTVIIKNNNTNSYTIYKLECKFGRLYEKDKE